MNHPQLDSVIHRVLAGDTDLFAEIIRFYQEDIWKVVAAMLLNNSETSDLVQQTFVSAYRHLHQFKKGSDFSAWLKQIARNSVRQEMRARGRELKRLEIYYQHLVSLWDDPYVDQSEEVLAEALRDCTSQLPPESAKIVQLRYESGCDFGQIASVIGRSVEAARQQLARIRIALRNCVQKRLPQS